MRVAPCTLLKFNNTQVIDYASDLRSAGLDKSETLRLQMKAQFSDGARTNSRLCTDLQFSHMYKELFLASYGGKRHPGIGDDEGLLLVCYWCGGKCR